MFAFFVTLYLALFEGEWVPVSTQWARTYFNDTIKTLLNLLLNAVGGNFTELQSLVYNGSVNPHIMLASIMALITFIGVCFATWKVIKYFFSIFFYGWRN